jgi:hypothetical protein
MSHKQIIRNSDFAEKEVATPTHLSVKGRKTGVISSTAIAVQ